MARMFFVFLFFFFNYSFLVIKIKRLIFKHTVSNEELKTFITRLLAADKNAFKRLWNV